MVRRRIKQASVQADDQVRRPCVGQPWSIPTPASIGLEKMRGSCGKRICFAGDHELFVRGNDQA